VALALSTTAALGRLDPATGRLTPLRFLAKTVTAPRGWSSSVTSTVPEPSTATP
jgi:hypothetical protein